MDKSYLFDSIINHIKASIIISDSNGHIKLVNSATEKIWDFSEKDFGQIKVDNLFCFESGGIAELFKLDNWSGEISAIRRDGEIIHLYVEISLIIDEDIGSKKYLIISESIEEKLSLLKKLDNKEKELEQSVKNLKKAEILMVEEDKLASLGHLAAGILHEINNPLGFIISNFGTLKKYVERLVGIVDLYKQVINKLATVNESLLSSNEYINLKEMENKYNLDFIMSDTVELVNDTEEGIERVQKIISAMRNFAHASKAMEFENYDLNEGINNTLVIAKNEIKYTANVKVELDEIPRVEAISSEINQVILNLIINSSHAIKERKESEDLSYFGLLTITTTSDESCVKCIIEDNGMGISKENLDKIFQPFFTTKPIGKGTGLGLSIANDIIKNKHKGDLTVESIPGEGTKITIILPIKQGCS